MKDSKKFIIVFQLLILISCQPVEKNYENKLWYKHPASNWMQALPVGNGRLGAMVFGNPQHERIQLNEDSLWPGGPDWGNSRVHPKICSE